MSIFDSIYTSPDALRAKYLRPKNVLQNIDEATSQTAIALVQTQLNVQNSATAIQSGSIAGGGYGGSNAGNNVDGGGKGRVTGGFETGRDFEQPLLD